MKLPAEVEALFDRLDSLGEEWTLAQQRTMRELATRLDVLPLACDALAFFALRRDGAVVSIDFEDGAVQLWDDIRVRDVMIAQGTKAYPELRMLLPARTTASLVCRECEGTGRARHEGQPLAANVVCWCGGLGWIPEDWPAK